MKSLLFIFLLAAGCAVVVGLTREYISINNGLEWDYAQSYCRKNYKDLATITTTEENNRLFQLVNDQSNPYESWIGLTATSDLNWIWSDGKQTSFLNFDDDYSTYYGVCAVISPYKQLWKKYDCSDTLAFYCYRYLILVNEMKTWEEAQLYCKTHYTGLAPMTSTQLELEATETQTQNVWIGLRFMDGQWFWVNGEKLGSLVSMPSLCPAPSYRCGALDTTTNTTKIHNCNDMLNFICYWS